MSAQQVSFVGLLDGKQPLQVLRVPHRVYSVDSTAAVDVSSAEQDVLSRAHRRQKTLEYVADIQPS